MTQNSKFKFHSDKYTHYCGFVATFKTYPDRAFTTKSTCPAGTFECSSHNDWICLPEAYKCDGVLNCAGGEDEDNCPNQVTYPLPDVDLTSSDAYARTADHDLMPGVEFTCASGDTIPATWACDGFLDCRDGSDELSCNSRASESALNSPDLASIFRYHTAKFKGDDLTYFSYPNYPNNYEVNSDYQWTIQISSGKKLRLYFIQFLLPDAKGCLTDHLSIIDGLTGDELVRYCRLPTMVPLYLTFDTTKIVINLHSDCDNVGKLLLAYKGVPSSAITPDLDSCYINGISYTGTVAETLTGDTCQNWDASFITSNSIPADPADFDLEPEKLLTAHLDHNYCRYPEEDIQAPFAQPYCIVVNNNVAEKKFCNVPECSDTYASCPANHFQCMDGQCLPNNLVCDGRYDCAYRDDELYCDVRGSESYTASHAFGSIQTADDGTTVAMTPGDYQFTENTHAGSLTITYAASVANDEIGLIYLYQLTGNSATVTVTSGPSSYAFTTAFENYIVGEFGQNLQVQITVATNGNLSNLGFEYKKTTCHQALTDFNVAYAVPSKDQQDDLCVFTISYTGQDQQTLKLDETVQMEGYLRRIYRATDCSHSFNAVTGEQYCDDAIPICQDQLSLTFQDGSSNVAIPFVHYDDDGVVMETLNRVCSNDFSVFKMLSNVDTELILTVTGTETKKFNLVYENLDPKIMDASSFEGTRVRQMTSECCGYDCDSNFKCLSDRCPGDEILPDFYFTDNVNSPATTSATTRKKRNSKIDAMINGCGNWTDWMSASEPSGVTLAGLTVSGGEYETYDRLRAQYDFCQNSEIVNIDCRVKGSGVHWTGSGDRKLTCHYLHGFICNNRAQAGKCQDYEVRFYCACDASASWDAGGAALTNQKPSLRVAPGYDPNSCQPGWTNWFDNSVKDEKISVLTDTPGSCLNPVGIQCRNIPDGSDPSDTQQPLFLIDQSGYQPSYECSLDVGLKCNQKAPCKPCRETEARLYCPCEEGSLFPEPITLPPPTEAPPDPRKYVECCADAACSTKTTCFGSCWSVVWYDVDFQGNYLENRQEFGCKEMTQCTPNYETLDCYPMDKRTSQVVCANCCGGLESPLFNNTLLDTLQVNATNFALCNSVTSNFYQEVRELAHRTIVKEKGSASSSNFLKFVVSYLFLMYLM